MKGLPVGAPRRAQIFILAVVLIASLAAACFPWGSSAPAPKTDLPASGAARTALPKPASANPAGPGKMLAPYKIGVVLALSGGLASIGLASRDGAVALANEINAVGGINGRKLELVIFDDGTDETKAVSAVKKAVNDDKVLAVVGPTGGASAMAAIPVVEEARAPMMAVASSDSIAHPVKKWVFKFVSGETKGIPEQFTYLRSMEVKKLALLSPDNATGKAGAAHVTATAAREGFDLVSQETYDPNDQDFAAQLARTRDSGAQGLIVYDSTATASLMAKQMKTMGISIPWTGPYGLLAPSILQAAGDAFEGMVVPAPKVYVAAQLPERDGQKRTLMLFINAVKKTTGKDPDLAGMHGWDGLLAIAEALKRSNPDPGNLDEARATIRDVIESLRNFPAAVSILDLGPTDHEGMPPNWMARVEVRGGKLVMANR